MLLSVKKTIFRLSRKVLHFDIEQNRHITGLKTFSLFSVDVLSELGLNHCLGALEALIC